MSLEAPSLQVCAAVIVEHGKILITKRPDHKPLGGRWEFPGGKLDANETVEQALIRELQEELDISIEVREHLQTVSHSYDWGQVEIMAYLCSRLSGNIRHLEVSDHAWVIPADLFNYDILEADRPILETLNSRFA